MTVVITTHVAEVYVQKAGRELLCNLYVFSDFLNSLPLSGQDLPLTLSGLELLILLLLSPELSK